VALEVQRGDVVIPRWRTCTNHWTPGYAFRHS